MQAPPTWSLWCWSSRCTRAYCSGARGRHQRRPFGSVNFLIAFSAKCGLFPALGREVWGAIDGCREASRLPGLACFVAQPADQTGKPGLEFSGDVRVEMVASIAGLSFAIVMGSVLDAARAAGDLRKRMRVDQVQELAIVKLAGCAPYLAFHLR